MYLFNLLNNIFLLLQGLTQDSGNYYLLFTSPTETQISYISISQKDRNKITHFRSFSPMPYIFIFINVHVRDLDT